MWNAGYRRPIRLDSAWTLRLIHCPRVAVFILVVHRSARAPLTRLRLYLASHFCDNILTPLLHEQSTRMARFAYPSCTPRGMIPRCTSKLRSDGVPCRASRRLFSVSFPCSQVSIVFPVYLCNSDNTTEHFAPLSHSPSSFRRPL